MKPPDEQVRRRLVDEWLRKAETDLRAAQVLLSCDPPLPYPSCFSSQQATEKFLKAFLVHSQVDFPKTHDIQQLLDLAEPIHADLAHSLGDVIALTQYAVEPRYPGDLPEPDPDEATAALALATKVRGAVCRRPEATALREAGVCRRNVAGNARSIPPRRCLPRPARRGTMTSWGGFRPARGPRRRIESSTA